MPPAFSPAALKILGPESGLPGDAGEHAGADFLAVVKGEDEIGAIVALENAGICLHPLYGFVYLPGSGLKGMARAYAETVWRAAKPVETRASALAEIERVFGLAPKGKTAGAAGTVVFHDAWPETWPQLIVDIVNNHHTKYYRGDDAPGDWEDPVPSYFLAVKAGVKFSFALSPRQDADADLALAKDWLTGALCHLGAGAKTAAGYGGFRLIDTSSPALPEGVRAVYEAPNETPLELVTPAFLAGAGQQKEDCDLRPATLRGLLRWWWRTMHAAYLTVDELRKLEDTVWGSTEAGSPVRIEIQPANVKKRLFHLKTLGRNTENQQILILNTGEAKRHRIKSAKGGTVPGVLYAAYGMDEMDAGDLASRKTRFFAEAGSRWTVKLTARAGQFTSDAKRKDKIDISAALILTRKTHGGWWV